MLKFEPWKSEILEDRVISNSGTSHLFLLKKVKVGLGLVLCKMKYKRNKQDQC